MARCEVCGREGAAYVCRLCSRRVCPECFDPATWLCRLCYERPLVKRERPAPTPTLPLASKVMLALGLAMIASGIILMMALPSLLGTQAPGSIVIWPFPLIVGFTSNQGSLPALIITLGIMLCFLALFAFIAYEWFKAFL